MSGTTLVDRSSGFLWVICEASTFFNPEVTDPPLFNSANRAACPPAGALIEVGAAAGGGGGGGGPPAAGAGVDEEGKEAGAEGPCIVRADQAGTNHATCLWVPRDPGSVPLLDVLLERVDESDNGFRPSRHSRVSNGQHQQRR